MNIHKKKCSKCKESKSLDNFPYKKSYCRSCGNLMSQIYKQKNKEKISDYNKRYKSSHKKEISEYNKKYDTDNRKEIQKRQTANQYNRRRTDINFKMSGTLRSRLNRFILGNYGSLKKLVGCDMTAFNKWLKHNFKEGMTFENHGSMWHNDHVIPCSMFNLENEVERKICFNWKNMRPLYASKNMSRKNKVDTKDFFSHEIKIKHFQINNKDEYNDIKINFLKYVVAEC
jgi:hypothetical protein